MQVKRDLVARISGGLNFPICRLLIDDNLNAAIFTPDRNEPTAVFKAHSDGTNGKGVTADGVEVFWRQRGSSCSYKLAKCNIKTPALAARWEA